ncbi:MAG: branched-chain amino acid aminotransferase, partial [Angelakisella sp.]
FHYGQTVFEGAKAYRAADGTIRLFRPDENFKRLNHSNDTLCIPRLDESLCLDALNQLIELEKDWVPEASAGSLYIRPFIIAVDDVLGVKPGDEYYFIIILSPSGAYYSSGLAPVKIYVEGTHVRAVRGGIGEAKTGGNYAASLTAQDEAHRSGYSQVLWLDGVERKYIEEVGAMNIFFVIDGEVVTPALTGSILSGITRKSAIELLRDWNIPVTERRISAEEVGEAGRNGTLTEVFGTGTAAVVSPVGELKYGDEVFKIGDGGIGALTQRLYDELTGIQFGKLPDTKHWSKIVCSAE